MATVLPLGNYLARNTPVHRIDARIKLLLLTVYISVLFICQTWLGLLVAGLILVSLFVVAQIPARMALRGLKPILVILLFTLLANGLTFSATAAGTTQGTADTMQSIALIGSFGIRPLGFVKGLYFALRICLLVFATTLLTYTSSVISLVEAISKLLAPLRRLRIPVDDLAMVLTIALRFIPLVASEAEKLVVAQSARGASFNQGGPVRRVKAWLPVMIPLFVSLFRRADYLAMAMESRCYVSHGRTQLTEGHINRADVVWVIFGSLLLIAVGVFL